MKSISELVNDLFHMHRKPSGREFSNKEVAQALNNEISADHIAKIRRGDTPNPGRNTLLLLCQYFHVSPTYFFPEYQEEETTVLDLSDESSVLLAKQIAELSPEARKQLTKLLDLLKPKKTE